MQSNIQYNNVFCVTLQPSIYVYSSNIHVILQLLSEVGPANSSERSPQTSPNLDPNDRYWSTGLPYCRGGTT
jgi:hypothetical protein